MKRSLSLTVCAGALIALIALSAAAQAQPARDKPAAKLQPAQPHKPLLPKKELAAKPGPAIAVKPPEPAPPLKPFKPDMPVAGARALPPPPARDPVGGPALAPSRAWTLPAIAAAGVVASAPASAAAPPGSAAFSAIRSRQLSDVLKRHGFVGDLKQDTRLGLPDAVLRDPARLAGVLADLRVFNPPTGNVTVMQRRLPDSNDSETAAALDELRSKGQLATVTAADALADAALRRQKQKLCVDAATALDAEEANVRTIGGGAEPGAYHGSAAFWQAVERTNVAAATAYRRTAEAYATACLDKQWQSLTGAQRKDMLAVVGFLQIDGQAECMGARIAADRFLTARHCLYRYDRNTGWERHAAGRTQVVLAGRTGEAFDTEELNCDVAPADAQCSRVSAGNPLAADHLVLRLKPRPAGTALPPMPALRVDQAAVRQMLVVPGRSPWITGRALTPSDPVFVTTADIGGCMVAMSQDGCLVNSCQSEPGFSGAPMFARRQVKELVLVGIFLGSTAQNPYQQCLWPNRNFGATLPQPVVAALK